MLKFLYILKEKTQKSLSPLDLFVQVIVLLDSTVTQTFWDIDMLKQIFLTLHILSILLLEQHTLEYISIDTLQIISEWIDSFLEMLQFTEILVVELWNV